MDRIESDKTVEINGKRMFSDGDPNAEEATEGTEINAQFLNGIQEEICGFIESQGIALDHSKKNQLAQAITKTFIKHLNPAIEALTYTIQRLGYDQDPDSNGKVAKLPKLIQGS